MSNRGKNSFKLEWSEYSRFKNCLAMESKDTAKCKVCQKMFKIDNAVISHSQGKIPNLKLILYLRIQR